MLAKTAKQSQPTKQKRHKIELTVNNSVFSRLQQMTHSKFGELSERKMKQLIRLIIQRHIDEFLDPLKLHYDPTGKMRSKRYELRVKLSTEEYATLTAIGTKSETNTQGALFGIVRDAIAKEQATSKDYRLLTKEDLPKPPKKRVSYKFMPNFLGR